MNSEWIDSDLINQKCVKLVKCERNIYSELVKEFLDNQIVKFMKEARKNDYKLSSRAQS